MSMKQVPSRREFLAVSAAAVAATAASVAAKPGTRAKVIAPDRITGANSRINVALVGAGAQGMRLAKHFQKFAGKHNMELNAVCDLWRVPREAAAADFEKANKRQTRMARNTEDLYAMSDLDAVIIATPDFSHARLAIEAVGAGKDAYVEKPFATVLAEANRAHDTIQKSGRVFQSGTQRRSDGKYIGAARFVQSGAFGDVVVVEMTWNVNQPDRWRRPELVQRLREEDTDWNRFLLGGPSMPFDPRKYVEWRLFSPFSSGIPNQWMSHQIDTVSMITGDPFPQSCVALGGIYAWHDGRENPDTFSAEFGFPKGFMVRYHSRMTQSRGGVREDYMSTAGTLDLEKETVTGEGGGKGHSLQHKRYDAAGGMNHMENWMACLRTRAKCNADVEAAYGHAVAAIMSTESLRTGRRVGFDSQKRETT